MNDAYDRQLAAQQDLELLCADLIRVSAQLEELATAWRRDHVAGVTTRELPLTFLGDLLAVPGQLSPLIAVAMALSSLFALCGQIWLE